MTTPGSATFALPGKAPLIERSDDPPNYETPVRDLRDVITPNDLLFVRYHTADIPRIEAASWRLQVGGEGADRRVEFGFDALERAFPAVELVAVCQCSGNGRGLLADKAPGVQWGAGAVGNARWRGARLADVLRCVGVKEEAVEVAFGAQQSGGAPEFARSLPAWKALHPDTIIAYEMNGAPLPRCNGFPARLVVPAWTAVYWVKHLARIDIRVRPLRNESMTRDYRIPSGLFPSTRRFTTQETPNDTPITEIMVNAVITSPPAHARIDPGLPITVGGVAWDAGHGIARVELSDDGGARWSEAALGPDIGRYSFRSWTARIVPRRPGPLEILARATNGLGHRQPSTPIANPAGYHNNAVARLTLEVGRGAPLDEAAAHRSQRKN